MRKIAHAHLAFYATLLGVFFTFKYLQGMIPQITVGETHTFLIALSFGLVAYFCVVERLFKSSTSRGLYSGSGLIFTNLAILGFFVTLPLGLEDSSRENFLLIGIILGLITFFLAIKMLSKESVVRAIFMSLPIGMFGVFLLTRETLYSEAIITFIVMDIALKYMSSLKVELPKKKALK